jgi:hypothetical protein
MIHWKVLVMIGRNDHSNPLVYAVEFDTQRAAEEAAVWFHDGGFHTTVIEDDEVAEPAEPAAATAPAQPSLAPAV